MTRWLTSIAILIVGTVPVIGSAQDQWSPGYAPPAGHYPAPGGYPPGAYCPPGAGTYAELLPHDRGFGYDGEFKRALTPVPRSWVRFDSLIWEMRGADNTLLGAPVLTNPGEEPFDLTGQDPTRRLTATDRINGPRTIPNLTSVIVPRIGSSEAGGEIGVRMSIGIPTTAGDFEADIWMLSEVEQNIGIRPFVDSRDPVAPETLIAAVTLFDDGMLSNGTMILFSENYRASLNTLLWGTEGNWVMEPFTPNVGIQVRPIVGFRYIHLRDDLRISGQDIPDPVNDPTTILNHQIFSGSENHVFGPQFGLSFESQIKRLTLGVETKFLFGINRLKDRVATSQIFAVDEMDRAEADENTRFSPVFDLSVFAKYQCTNSISVFAGYEALVGDGFSRAYDNIDYNAPAAVTDPPDIGLKNELDKFYAHGLSLGLEILFP